MIREHPVGDIISLDGTVLRITPGCLVRHHMDNRSMGTVIGHVGDEFAVMWSKAPHLLDRDDKLKYQQRVIQNHMKQALLHMVSRKVDAAQANRIKTIAAMTMQNFLNQGTVLNYSVTVDLDPARWQHVLRVRYQLAPMATYYVLTLTFN